VIQNTSVRLQFLITVLWFLEDPGASGRIILKWIFKKWDEGIGCINVAQDKERRRAVVNAVMDLRVP
jgi:hypothetical protein